MSDQKFYDYYDRLYSRKDYDKESAIIYNCLKNISTAPVRHLMDLGCGTGNHSFAFAKMGLTVSGVDPSEYAITIARGKLQKSHQNPTFYCGNVQNFHNQQLDAVVSLFFVANYLLKTVELWNFFQGIYNNLKPNSAFIFDCWHGEVAIYDPPKEKITKIPFTAGNEAVDNIECRVMPKLDVKSKIVNLQTFVSASKGEEEIDKFLYSYRIKLWRRQELQNILNDIGFKVISINKWMTSDRPAENKDWKLMFLCKRP